MIAELAVLKGWNPGHVFVLSEGKDKFFFGRAEQCELQVVQQGVSRLHFSVERHGTLFYVVDQGSSNGTFLNGERVQRSVLKLNDIITAGEVSMLFRRAGHATSAPPPEKWKAKEGDIVKRFDLSKTVIMDTGVLRGGEDPVSALKKALATVYRVGAIINTESDLDHILDSIMNVVVKTFGADRGFLITANKDRNIVETRVMRIEGGQKILEEVPLTRTIVNKAIKEGLSVLSADILMDERFSPSESAIKGDIRSVMCVPLVSHHNVVGAIYLDTVGRLAEFAERDLELLSALGTQVGAAMEKIALFHDLERLFIGAIQALAAAIDAKDEYTHGHSERVTDFSVAVAKELGLSHADVQTVRLAALLHDVGKIGIPEEVLLKPGKLTPDEFEIMKRHPVLSGKILEKIGNAEAIISGAKFHHERLDGTGYPEGLKDDKIPLFARIICVSDAFDAMTSRRHYRRNLSDDEALNEIRRCTGTQFDPRVAEAFLQCYGKGQIISRTTAEARAISGAPVAGREATHAEEALPPTRAMPVLPPPIPMSGS